ncbi:phosphoribosylglycinamide formyltransferase [Salirhabdus salicampi]|uniref:phosphoribosylglycinamide formyltransferase n=1 Tax=Salirhabdus salicampi TaxID=476102 RepID=UPI0020C30654|nr:phosphoribosylglycinamide formyltransferase [Salirhabdus salicampi]MCP8618003.1 phosphoribosylglycinamide formyltransferase [Salirhabdus salicampi]
MSNRLKIAVFASGNGSNFTSIVDFSSHSQSSFEVVLLICDRPQAKVINRAKQAGIPTFVFSPKQYESKEQFESEIVQKLHVAGVQFIALAGYMRLIGKTLLEEYKQRIVNIHPSLLPKFPGKDAVGQALQKGVSETGATVHYVDEGMDTGPIIAQQSVPIPPNSDRDDVQAIIQQVEHQLYPQVLHELCKKVMEGAKS